MASGHVSFYQPPPSGTKTVKITCVKHMPSVAIAMAREGTNRLDAARQAGMGRQTLRDWVHRYDEAAVDGPVSLPAPSPRPS